MTSTPEERLSRVVSLVAELSRDDGAVDGISFEELADRFGTTVSAIASDVRALTSLGESAADDWLLSLHLWQEGDRLAGRSQGPFRRPIRLTGEEVLALRVGLAADPTAAERLSPDLRRTLLGEDTEGNGEEAPTIALARANGDGAAVQSLLLDAIHWGRRVQVRYLTPADGEPRERTVHPYRLLEDRGFVYLSAWCEAGEGWRRFRLDRVVEASLRDDEFQRRSDEEVGREAEAVYQEPEQGAVEEVRVRFSPEVSRWIAERHPHGERGEDGSLTVTYRVASPHWLVRHVLQYGDAAEVVGPEPYREAITAAAGS